MQAALDDWSRAGPALATLAARLGSGSITGERFEEARLGPPLPRAYEWIDGSAFLNHVRLVRKARGATPPPTLEIDPLVYQGGSGVLLGPRDDLLLADPEWGLDFESEVAVIVGDVPRGTTAAQAAAYVRLVVLANDVTLRNLVPGELAKGFGFFQSKPATAFSPFAATLDELGAAWRDGRLHLPLRTTLKRAGAAAHLVGDPNAGAEMHFSFFDLDRARGAHAGPHRRDDPGRRHRLERRPGARCLLPGRAARARDDRRRRAADAVPRRRRCGRHRDARRRRTRPVRPHRPARGERVW